MAVTVDMLPSSVVRVTSRDAATLSLGATPSSTVTFSPALGTSVTAKSGEDGSVAVPSLPCPSLSEVTWGDGTSSYAAWLEVVARHYCSTDDVLDCGDDQSSPRSIGCTEAQAFEARAQATDVIEQAARRSFVPVTCEEGISCSRGDASILGWPDVSSVSIVDATDSAATVTLVGDSMARLEHSTRESIVYVHGLKRFPEPVRRACATLAASYLLPSRIPSRASGESTDAGFLRYTLAGVDGATGIPEVDAVIQQYGRHRMEVA